MSTKRRSKLIREAEWVAEVEVDLIEDGSGWGPYLSIEDGRKLDRVRAALCAGDLHAAEELGRVYRLTPVSAA